MINLIRRARRTRQSIAIRSLICENQIKVTDLILPLFVLNENKKTRAISSMPGVFCYSQDDLLKVCNKAISLGIVAIVLFPVIDKELKDKKASYACSEDNFYLKVIEKVKAEYPDILVITDVALDPYSSDGHDGLLSDKQEILNDETLPLLAKMSVLHASAGADIIAPSDMMDGRIKVIRSELDNFGYENVLVMSYAVKYASAFYAPFRDALDSAPGVGDKKTYQMDPANVREAILEAQLDFSEGADIIMVKPGLAYLDVIKSLRNEILIPLAAYNVSGEYSMIKSAAQNGWLDYNQTIQEIMISFKRAGCDLILSYHALDLAEILKKL